MTKRALMLGLASTAFFGTLIFGVAWQVIWNFPDHPINWLHTMIGWGAFSLLVAAMAASLGRCAYTYEAEMSAAATNRCSSEAGGR